MKRMRWEKIESICKRGIIFIIILTSILVVIVLIRPQNEPRKELIETNTVKPADIKKDTELTQVMDYTPENYNLYDKMTDLSFTNEKGEKVELKDLRGKLIILNFWASWCPDCQNEMKRANEIKVLLSKYKDVNFVLINKLDGTKETRKKAMNYLAENKIPFTALFDDGAAVYKKIGVKRIPTVLIMDENGVLKACINEEQLDLEKLEATIQLELAGRENTLLHFITERLTNKEGGIFTNYYDEANTVPSGKDVLSESQGLMMEYAVNKKDKDLFEQAWQYINKRMMKNKLAAWVVTDKEAASTNAVLDDLRIYNALDEGDKLWGGYSQILKNYQEALYKYNTDKKYLIDFYDFKFKQKAECLTLCNVDLKALKKLAEGDFKWREVTENSSEIVVNGVISSAFPMYYSRYNYRTKAYEQDAINMAEAMVTLLHLAEMGQLPNQSLEWIQEAVEGEGVFAKYNIDGTVAEGYKYESTAIYAQIALIAEIVGNKELANKSLERMQAHQVVDIKSDVIGCFGEADGKGIYSFDQMMALYAYRMLENREVLK